MKKLGFALGAGGSRGVAHVGFLQAMEEAGIRPDYVSGCSMGAIIGACYCAGASPADMKSVVIDLKLADIAAVNISPVRRNGLMRMTKARKLMADLIGEKSFDELRIPFVCVATDLIKGKLVVMSKGNVIDAALASGSIPGAFTPAQFGGHSMLVDGAILERVPTREVKNLGAEAIVAVDVLGNLVVEKEVQGNIVDTLLRCMDIMDTRATQRKRQSRRYVDLWLEPDLGSMDQYAVKDLSFAYYKGYELGISKAEEIKRIYRDGSV